MLRRTLLVLLTIYVVGVVLVAEWPVPVDGGVDGVLDHWIEKLDAHGVTFVSYDLIESLANVAFFIPLSVLLAAIAGRGRFVMVFAVCVAISLTIELSQAVLLPARLASAGDILANSLGALVGVSLVAVLSSVRASRRRRSRSSSLG